MRCPRCGEVAPEGAALCDNCDEILDASLLDSFDEPVPAGERTDVGPAPTADRPNRDLRPARLSQRGGWSPRPGAPQPVQQAERRPFLAEAPKPPPPSPLEEARRTAGDLKAFFAALSPGDRLGAGAAVALLVALCLPWRWTKADDEIIGLVAAWPLFLLAGGVVALVYVRARRADAALARKLRLAQGVAAALCAALAGLFLPWATESRSVRAASLAVSVQQSKPELGAYLGLICAVGVLVGSLQAALGERRT